MKWVGNIPAGESMNYTSKGCFIGRPRPNITRPGQSVDDLEKAGLVGVYEQDIVKIDLNYGPGTLIDASRQPPVPVTGSVDIGPSVKAIAKAYENYCKPESTLDNRIKECKKEQNNPKKYRARWTGTGYVYERTDE